MKIAGSKMKLLSVGGRTIILLHVLTSMAIHLLAMLHVPKVVIKTLNKLLSSLFDGEYNGKGKIKQIYWNHICRPMDEGGLGIRDYEGIQKALHWKLAWSLVKAWSLIKGQYLWVDFFRGKYAKGNHLSLVMPTKGTHFWTSVASNILEVLNSSKWSIRDGNFFFWYENWAEEGPLCGLYPIIDNPLLKIKGCQLENEWAFSLGLVGQ